ncbi:hypothetical protein H257_16279 [Aphanomyces astaci]|uniref:Uncharacterized protein n=1 Tax=Aphanomyces astaci TaxID=112090 RepID=W4FLK5_APHAT|nr:hypothetical protein H257_16279 [Aphanomyces astaci]ETV67548.1 hypothetical protein H257_16279 [Aphanomyces astaci]|eukprot:XP_009842952.1 hypothetical protein H257_16279 [Aphanomyces astaci]
MTVLGRAPKFLLWKDETVVPRQLQSKSHISKVMFFVAVARPRNDWDGKIGCWEITERMPSARTSRNRPAGTEVLTSITGTKDVNRRMLVAMVVPAIKRKWIWPAGVENGRIILQHDNDRHHIPSGDAEFVDAEQHALKQTLECRTMEELIAAVKCSFMLLSPVTLEKTFMTLRRSMNVIIEANGCNRYEIPRSKVNAEDELALSMTNLRLEEEDRLEEVASLLGTLNMDV